MASEQQVIELKLRSGQMKVFEGDQFDLKEHALGFYVVINVKTGERVWSEGVRDGIRDVVQARVKNYKHGPEPTAD